MRCVLGIDTSNYTTSLSAIEVESGQEAADARHLLPVEFGKRGLRQSDALFFHVRQLPGLMDTLMGRLRGAKEPVTIEAIAVSTRPRPLASSYMPVFTAGVSLAQSLGRVLGVPVLSTSHQEGHLAAAVANQAVDEAAQFLAVHLSGGTSDVLCAAKTAWGYRITTVGEGSDLHAGQFIDRVGVALGCAFPAGPALEQLAATEVKGAAPVSIPSRVSGSSMSFSGPCSAALRAVEAGESPAAVALGVQRSVANSVAKAVLHAARCHPGIRSCVIAGGVAENQFIRLRIADRVRRERADLKLFFAPPRLSADNAFGVARLGWRHWCALST